MKSVDQLAGGTRASHRRVAKPVAVARPGGGSDREARILARRDGVAIALGRVTKLRVNAISYPALRALDSRLSQRGAIK